MYPGKKNLQQPEHAHNSRHFNPELALHDDEFVLHPMKSNKKVSHKLKTRPFQDPRLHLLEGLLDHFDIDRSPIENSHQHLKQHKRPGKQMRQSVVHGGNGKPEIEFHIEIEFEDEEDRKHAFDDDAGHHEVVLPGRKRGPMAPLPGLEYAAEPLIPNREYNGPKAPKPGRKFKHDPLLLGREYGPDPLLIGHEYGPNPQLAGHGLDGHDVPLHELLHPLHPASLHFHDQRPNKVPRKQKFPSKGPIVDQIDPLELLGLIELLEHDYKNHPRNHHKPSAGSRGSTMRNGPAKLRGLARKAEHAKEFRLTKRRRR